MRSAFRFAAAFVGGILTGAAGIAWASPGAPGDPLPVIMSAGGLAFSGGALFKAIQIAQEYGRQKQQVDTLQVEVNRLRDKTVLGDVYGGDMGRVDARLRNIERKIGISE